MHLGVGMQYVLYQSLASVSKAIQILLVLIRLIFLNLSNRSEFFLSLAANAADDSAKFPSSR